MTMPLPDGEYPAFVVDLETDTHEDGEPVAHFELTITAGDHKGDVVAVSVAGVEVDFVDLIGMPATITVTDGNPRVAIDR